MSKHKDKKPKEEVKEESKAPSAEVSETEAEAEVKEITHVSLVRDFKEVLSAIPGGNREIDLAVEDSMKLLESLKGLMVFIDKALNEKKK